LSYVYGTAKAGEKDLLSSIYSTIIYSYYLFQIFLGNNDQNSIRTLQLNPPIMTQYIRINPRNWTGSIALRMEFSGCSQAEQFHCK